MISSIIQGLSFINIQPNMSEQEKKRWIYDLLFAENKPKFFVYSIQSKDKKSIFKEKREYRIEQKTKKKGFLTALVTAIKKDPTTSRRKHTNELKVHEKTARTAIKQDLTPDFNSPWLRYMQQIQILIHLKLLLSSNGVKCLQNLFWRHANRFEGILIQWLKKWWSYWVKYLFCVELLILLLIF